mgnify:CR=1 FL=1
MDSDDTKSSNPNSRRADQTQGRELKEEEFSSALGEELIVTEDMQASEGDEEPSSPLSESDFEPLALYGFSAKYPKTTRLELNPKSTREKGDVAFHLEGALKIFLSWGSLEEARKRYATAAAQASGSIERSLKSTRARLDGTPETRNIKIQEHDAVYTHAKMFVERGGFPFGTRRVFQEAYALYVHCENTGRYYVVYAFAKPEATEEVAKIFDPIMSSLKCHLP